MPYFESSFWLKEVVLVREVPDEGILYSDRFSRWGDPTTDYHILNESIGNFWLLKESIIRSLSLSVSLASLLVSCNSVCYFLSSSPPIFLSSFSLFISLAGGSRRECSPTSGTLILAVISATWRWNLPADSRRSRIFSRRSRCACRARQQAPNKRTCGPRSRGPLRPASESSGTASGAEICTFSSANTDKIMILGLFP